MDPLDRLIDGIRQATELPHSKYNHQCPHLDYGKSADKALGAYCTAKKKLVEPEDCEGCADNLKEYFKANIQCPRCKGYNTTRKPLIYDDGEASEDTEECKCNDCGFEYLLV
jgi:predicted Zn-ribbon and HTH transcriptional regulator